MPDTIKVGTNRIANSASYSNTGSFRVARWNGSGSIAF